MNDPNRMPPSGVPVPAAPAANQSAAAPPPLDPPLPDHPGLRELFESLLRHPAELARRLGDPGFEAAGRLAALALGSAAVFGVVLGTFAMHEQLWAAPLKVAVGLLFSAVICFPSLYIFGSLAGGRSSAAHVAGCLAAALALAGLLLLGFAPAVWIFTQSTDSFGFMGFLSLAAWGVSLGFGLAFLFRALRAAGAARRAPLAVWAGIFILVTLQMSTSLRPILGRADKLITTEKRFFLEHWIESCGRALDCPQPAATQAPESRAEEP